MADWGRVAESCGEVLHDYFSAASSMWPAACALLAVVALLSSQPVRDWYQRRSRVTALLLHGLLVTGALVWAWQRVSLFDDASISLRYADNLVHGHGLVWNPGERVEGYTNFLWTVILAGGMRLGIDGEQLAIGACLLCLASEIILVSRVSTLLGGGVRRIPWAAILLATNLIFTDYGTTGMETMFAALLVTASFERALLGRLFTAGVLGVAAAMTHPDHALFYAGLGVALLIEKRSIRALVPYGIPFLAIYLPYFIARWRYYGDAFPNTYYAKSGGDAYWSQGVIYLVVSAFGTGLVAMAPLVMAGWRRIGTPLLKRFLLFACLPYVIYVAKVGGDFMLGRLLVTLLPFAALVAQIGWAQVLESAPWMRRAGMTAVFALACLPVVILPGQLTRWHITHESHWYPVRSFSPVVVESTGARRLAAIQRLTDAGLRPLLAEAAVGLIGYRSRLPIIDVLGLTDRHVAHQALSSRGRPGHEKHVDTDYLRERGVTLSVESFYEKAYAHFSAAKLDGEPFFLRRFEPGLVATLQRAGLEVPTPSPEIDRLVASADSEPLKSLRSEFRFLDEFYFSVNPDPSRRQRLVEAIERRDREQLDASR